MLQKIPSVCVALILILASVSAARRRLNSISELRNCFLFKSTNILELLHWFATTVDIDGDIIWLTFNPYNDYGSHHYRNSDGLLDSLPHGYSYYTVGNVNKPTSVRLPSYVVHPQRRYDGWNKARIIFRLREGNAGPRVKLIDQIFITQHFGTSDNQGTAYDPDHTYEVTTNLLLQIRRYTINEIYEHPASSLVGPFRNTSDAHYQGFHNSNQHDNKPIYEATTNQNDCMCSFCVVFIVLFFFACLWLYSGFGRK